MVAAARLDSQSHVTRVESSIPELGPEHFEYLGNALENPPYECGLSGTRIIARTPSQDEGWDAGPDTEGLTLDLEWELSQGHSRDHLIYEPPIPPLVLEMIRLRREAREEYLRRCEHKQWTERALSACVGTQLIRL